MQSISNISSHASDATRQIQDPKAAAQAKGPEKNQEKTDLQPKPQFDEYIPHEEKKASGQYWLERQEGKGLQIHFDDPRKNASEGVKPTAATAEPAKAEPAKADSPAAKPADQSPEAPVSAPADKPEPMKADKADKPEPKKPEEDDPKKKTEECICDTGKVDREIEALRRKQADMKQQVRTGSEEDAAKMEQELAKVERELAMKDNDSYRKSHAQYTNK